MNKRERAVEAYLKALRTGEASATATAAKHLANDVTLNTVGAHMWGNGPEEFKGKDAVVYQITGIGVMTNVYRTAPWTAPVSEGDKVTVSAEPGGLISSTTLTFTFNDQDQITHVDQVNKGGAPAAAGKVIPPHAKAFIDSALANNTPAVVAYTGDNGAPVLSMRGSTVVYSDTELAMWVRHAGGGMAKTLAKNPAMSLMWRDNGSRANVMVEGTARFDDDPEVRDRVFELIAETEQRHDLGRTGAALIIDVKKMMGSTPRGGIRVDRTS